MSKLTYTNKVALSVNPSVAAANKVQDSDMNSIKNAVNENGSYAEVQTGDVGGEFYCELEGTLSSGDAIKIKIPDGYNINTACKVSIDGGNNYYNVIDVAGNNVSAKTLAGRNVELVFNGTKFVSTSNTWNYLQQVTGTTHISLPATFNELLVVGEIPAYHIVYTINIPYDYLEPTQKKQYITGYYSGSQDNGIYDVLANQSELYLTNSKIGGANKMNDTNTTVYYR